MQHGIEQLESPIHAAADIETAFSHYLVAIENNDWDTAIRFFSADAQGGNTQHGVQPGRREGVYRFMAGARPDWKLRCVWYTVSRNHVLYKWRQILPGTRPEGGDYHFSGYCELHYAGNGQFDWIFSFPDSWSMQRVKQEWEQRQR